MHEFTDEGLATHDRDIRAQALREAADVVKKHTGRLESADGADEVVSLIESVIRHRAARLTDTTEETTT